MKRLFDIVGACIAVAGSSPVIMLAALAIVIEDGTPVFFRQERAGLRGRSFRIVKLRSMKVAPPGTVPSQDGRRMLRTGRLLRACSIDELPSLWNVILGEMSLVGPRPLLPEYTDQYSTHQRRRLEVKPGLTGWAQVNGRNSISWEEKFRLDVWYVDNRSLWLDVKILALTVVQVLSCRGISAPAHATMPPFEGSGAKASE